MMPSRCPTSVNAISLRDERPSDEAFLYELYASTRQDELEAAGWPPEMRGGFLTMQFRARQQGYRSAFEGAEFKIIQVDGVNAGEIILYRSADGLRVVDIALLPQFRNVGVGTTILRRVLDEAAAARQRVHLKVGRACRAERLYLRLGFAKISETELDEELEWRAPAESAAGQ
jgi:GNAT superfamily N-acetyltransferase